MKQQPQAFVVVLTGGIASGKSTVSEYFAQLGVPVIDTDRIAHRLVEPGQPALELIVQQLGADYLCSDGQLNRSKLRTDMFRDKQLKARLESILHPLIWSEAAKMIALVHQPYCILVVPLLAESNHWPFINRVLVVDTDESRQVQRVMERDSIGKEQAALILLAQATRSERLKLADDVICNSGSKEALRQQVVLLHEKYSQLAKSDPGSLNGNDSEARETR